MSTTNTAAASTLATRDARLADCRQNADRVAVEELGTETNRDVTVTSTVTTAVKTGDKVRKTNVTATVGLSVSDVTETEAAKK